MNRKSTIVCAAFAVAAYGLNPAYAETFTPIPALGNSVLDFDTQSGNYSGWQIADVGSINAIRTTLQVHRLGNDPRWIPTFSIILANSDRNVVFQLVSPKDDPPLFMFLKRHEGGKSADEQQFSTTVGVDEKLDVSIDWTPDGTVTVRAGEETRTINLGAPVTSLQLSGSTGEIEFNPLRIGHAAP